MYISCVNGDSHFKFFSTSRCKCACELVFLSQTFTRVRNEDLLSRLTAILSIVPFRVSQLLAHHCHGDGALPYMANASSCRHRFAPTLHLEVRHLPAEEVDINED